jgi:hypothetical protein
MWERVREEGTTMWRGRGDEGGTGHIGGGR